MPHDARVGPLLHLDRALTGATDTTEGLARLFAQHFPAEGLVALLASPARQILLAAITALGDKGTLAHCPLLAALLRHDSPQVVERAEDSLWRIWMQAGSPWGNGQLAKATELIADGRLAEALDVLEALAIAEPTFAEAHHQRGIVLCLNEQLDAAAAAFRETLHYNEYHFSAAINLGHVYAQQGQTRTALMQYRRALELHPRQANVRKLVERLEELVA